ncbi:MAG: isoleucine--tRNA ligase [Candidatus Cloacimonetes bacterium]|nr:isoleucine--tRNA ligase [Candidatus Cloacimonadota bacterium]
MFKPMNLKQKAAEFEKAVREYWETNAIDRESVSFREGAPKYIFFEGPPTANGKPGIHHVISRALKDTICRYKTMKGYQVSRKAGWDTHGLPVEIEVQKQLGIHDKKGIEAYGIQEFNERCKQSVFTYLDLWEKMTRQMGYWLDLDDPYITLQNDYIESLWWLLNQFWSAGLIYKGYRIVPYCPVCGTPLSSHEVAQGYRDAEDPSVFVRFKLSDEDDTFFLAWTTTPWTLISNAALAVHPDERYVKVQYGDEKLILAKKRLDILEEDYTILEENSGKDLEFTNYEPLYRFVEPEKRAWYVACADYVTMDDGTGIVHTAPAFGQDDFALGTKYGLPVIQPVDGAGRFTDAVTDWAGVFVKDADKDIIRNLKERGLLYRRQQILHTYPFCWRCDSPLIYMARTSWYIRTTDYSDRMMHHNAQVNWYPPFVGEKRFGEWLVNNVDWALSRDRFWGTPLNVWVCDSCGAQDSAGSIAELREKGRLENGADVPADIELHRPYIDDVVFDCPKCGKAMHRTPEVIDCWFDSGAMPFAQWHYPFENEELFDSERFPADFISEGIDQTRGWFYTMLAISSFIKDKAPFKNVLVNDMILDAKGKKMSKSKGNAVDPIELMDKYGADAVRWYLLAVSPPWVPTKFDTRGVEEVVNKFFGTLRNVYSFFATYANIDDFSFSPAELNEPHGHELDRWVISRLNTVIRDVTRHMEGYDLTRAVRTLQAFVVDDVSNWYVRRSRRRYWSMSVTGDKRDAYLTLALVLRDVARLIAPFAPFLSEDIWRSLTDGRSVHMADYPTADESLIDEKLEREMRSVIEVVSLGRAARNNAQIKVRQPLSCICVPEALQPSIGRMEELVKEEINVQRVDYLHHRDSIVRYEVKPNFKTLGPKVGKNMKVVAAALRETDAGHIREAFQKGEPFYLETAGKSHKITEEDLTFNIVEREGWSFESDRGLFVALDLRLTPELIEEGLARELVNKIQFTRKELDFDIMDRIGINYYADDEIAEVFERHGNYIMSETLAESVHRETVSRPDMKAWDINGKEVLLSIVRM